MVRSVPIRVRWTHDIGEPAVKKRDLMDRDFDIFLFVVRGSEAEVTDQVLDVLGEGHAWGAGTGRW